MLGQLYHGGMGEGAGHDSVRHPPEHAGAIGHRFPLPHLDVGGLQVDRLAAELEHPDLEAHPRAQRGLLEQHRQRSTREQLSLRVATGLPRRLEEASGGDQGEGAFAGEVGDAAEMPERGLRCDQRRAYRRHDRRCLRPLRATGRVEERSQAPHTIERRRRRGGWRRGEIANSFHGLTHSLRRDATLAEEARRDGLSFRNDCEQQMLRADVVRR